MAYKTLLCLLTVLSGLASLIESTSPPTEHESCDVWDRIARQLTSTGTQQKCWSNGTNPCTRIDCSGAYEYNNKNLEGFRTDHPIEVDYCFGVILNHCHDNISLDFYMQVPALNLSRTNRVYHNTLLSIPGLSLSFGNSTSADGFLFFEMKRSPENVTFSVTVRVRLSYGNNTFWPQTLERQLIASETVPVPPCLSEFTNFSTAPSIGTCHPPHYKASQPLIYTADFGKKCNEAEPCSQSWLTCTNDTCLCKPEWVQMRTGCLPRSRCNLPCESDKECSAEMNELCLDGKCQCQKGDFFDTSQKAWRVVPYSTSEPQHMSSKNNAQNKAAVIAGAVVGGLVVLAGILLVAYFALRRLRRPYHSREQLLDAEDSDGFM